jgi:YVTN family beta-propeller protein
MPRLTRIARQSLLLDRYWSALRRGERGTPPADLEPDLVAFTDDLARDIARRDPPDAFITGLRRRLEAQATATTEQNRRSWAGPAVGPNSHRPDFSRAIKEHEEQRVISELDLSQPRPESTPLAQRRWASEALELAAVAVIIITIGAILALALRDDDDTPAVGSPDPTPTPVVEPSPTATAAPASSPTVIAQVVSPTVAQAATPTEAPAATEIVPAPVVMDPPAAELPLAGQITATIPVGVGPSAMAAGHGAIWVQNDHEGSIPRIDPATNAVVATITITEPVAAPQSASQYLWFRQANPDLAIDATSVWAILPEAQALARIDPQTNTVVATIPLAAKATSIAVDGSSLWVALYGISSVVRIDTTTLEVVATIPNVSNPAGIAVTHDAVWVTNYTSDSVTRIDPATNQIVAEISISGPGAWRDQCGLCVTEVLANDQGVWVTLPVVDAITRIDPATNRQAAIIPVGFYPCSLASDARGVWVGHLVSTGLLLIDPRSNQVVAAVPATDASNRLAWIALSENTIWAARQPTNDVARIELQPE